MAKNSRTARKTTSAIRKPRAVTRSATGKDGDAVNEYMKLLDHPMKDQVNEVREIIKNADKNIGERIKWNAPSYHYQGEDMVTFNLRTKELIHLVFHHPAIVKIKSPLLEGDYKDRRMTYFKTPEAVTANKKELKRIISELISLI